MLNISRKIFISILCCCLSNIYAANSWDKYLSENTPPKIKVPKVVKSSTNKNSIVSAKAEVAQVYSNKLNQVQSQTSSEIDEDVFIEDSYSDKAFSQWFDNNISPQFFLRAGLIEETQFGLYGKTDIGILDFKCRIFDAVDFLPGATLDLWVFGDGLYFFDNPNIQYFPDSLISTGVDVGLWWRFANGFSWEFRCAPGIYSETSAAKFSYTGSINLHYTWSEEICFLLGIMYRPDWDIELFPCAGLLWQPNDSVRLLLGVPQTRVDLLPRHIVNFFGIISWNNTTYWLDSNKNNVETLTLDAVRASIGATLTLFDDLELTAEFGTHFHNEFKSEGIGKETIDLDNSTFIRASIGNHF